MPDLFHFVKGSLVQTDALAYGAKDENCFRVTSSFRMTDPSKIYTAYSMLPGTILLQQQSGDSNKVNLILKPKLSTSIKMPVKYVVYRGLQITSFLNGTNILTSQVLTTGSELIVEINKIQQSRGTDIISKKALFGYDLTPADAHNIDDFFYTNQADTVSQLFSISGGVELGNFAAVGANETNNEGVGMEIILENPDLAFTVEIAKRSSWKIDVAGITDEAEKKWTKEQIRHFVDPAAFYGLHSDIKEGIGYRAVSENENETEAKTKGAQEVYNNIIDKFATKHNVYLDIRSENGYSYNYYDIYEDGNFRLSITGGALQIVQYKWENWPIYVIHSLTNYVDKFKYFGFDIELQKADDTNSKPIILGRYAKNIAMQANYEVKNKKNIFLIDNLVFDTGQSYPTQYATVLVPSFKNNDINQHLSTIVRLDYIRKPDAGNTSLFSQKASADFIFPTEVKIPWQGKEQIKWMNSYIDRCFYGKAQQGGVVDAVDTIAVMQSGMAEEEIGNVKCFTYYAAPTVFFRSPKIIKDTYDFNFNGAAQSSPSTRFNFLTFFDRKSSAWIKKEEIGGINIFSYITTNEIKSGDAFLLGIAGSERSKLLDSISSSPYHHIFFKLEQVNTSNSTVNTYKLFVVGLNEVINAPTKSTESVEVFSIDGKIFTSVAYQNAVEFEAQQGIAIHFRRTKEYKSNKLFHFGFDWMRDGGKYDKGSEEDPYIKVSKAKTGLCEQANINGTNISDKAEAQAYLKYEYNFEEINKETYYVPWLCMYGPNLQNGTELVDTPPKEQVILKLYTQCTNKQKEEIVTFVPSEGIEIKLNKPIDKEKNSLKSYVSNLDNITVQCTAKSDQDRTIEVLDKNNLLVGKLNIFKNIKEITRKVCFMNLTLIGELPLTSSRTAKFEETKIFPDSQIKNTSYPTSKSKAKWHSYLKNDQKNFYTKKILHQALVKYEPENINDDGIIDKVNIKITFSYDNTSKIINNNSHVEISSIRNGGAVWTESIGFAENDQIPVCTDNFLKTIKDVAYENINDIDYPTVTFQDSDTAGAKFKSLLDEVKNAHNSTVNGLFESFTNFIFFPGCLWRFNDMGITTLANSKVTAFAYSNFIVLCGIPIAEDIETIAHEIAHNLGLMHSFIDKYNDKKKFIFQQYKTENIMDYSNAEKNSSIAPKVSFWKWQWEYILDNND